MAHFRDLFGYLVRKFSSDLDLVGAHDEQGMANLARQISDKMHRQGESLHWRTIKSQLETTGLVHPPHNRVRRKLIAYLVAGLRYKVPGIDASWFDKSLDELRRETEKGLPPISPDNHEGHAHFHWSYPGLPSDTFSRLNRDLCRPYVSYRYALENADNGFPRAVVAREVITFDENGQNIDFAMTFRPGGSHSSGKQALFEGKVIPLGQSLFCIAQHTDTADLNYVRGRSLFMEREERVRKCRFGVLSTTMATSPFAPCSACVVLFQANITKDEIEEFRRRVTVIFPLEDIIASDFSALTPAQRKMMKIFLNNAPRIHSKGRQDTVLRLWLDRFEAQMPDIAERLYKPGARVPFGANWKRSKVLGQ